MEKDWGAQRLRLEKRVKHLTATIERLEKEAGGGSSGGAESKAVQSAVTAAQKEANDVIHQLKQRIKTQEESYKLLGDKLNAAERDSQKQKEKAATAVKAHKALSAEFAALKEKHRLAVEKHSKEAKAPPAPAKPAPATATAAATKEVKEGTAAGSGGKGAAPPATSSSATPAAAGAPAPATADNSALIATLNDRIRTLERALRLAQRSPAAMAAAAAAPAATATTTAPPKPPGSALVSAGRTISAPSTKAEGGKEAGAEGGKKEAWPESKAPANGEGASGSAHAQWQEKKKLQQQISALRGSVEVWGRLCDRCSALTESFGGQIKWLRKSGASLSWKL
jgi:hypothetical protein